MFDYNQETKKQKYDTFWRHISRNNYYHFCTNEGLRDMSHFIDKLKVSSVLDYGCGNNDLSYVMGDSYKNIEFTSYDPHITIHSQKPTSPKDLVVCYNVLQVVEDENLDSVINDLYNLANMYVLIHISSTGFFNREHSYYDEIFSEKYSNMFVIMDKHTQNNRINVMRENLDKNDIYFYFTKTIKTNFLLLKKNKSKHN